MANKVSKGAAGYQFRPETNYTCGMCVFRKGSSGCAIFGPSFPVSSSSGTCIEFIHGPENVVPWLGLLTPQEASYTVNTNGFSCKRCEYFGAGQNNCQKVDSKSKGDTPGVISPNGCCNLWVGDSKRGKLPDVSLQSLLAFSRAKKVLSGS